MEEIYLWIQMRDMQLVGLTKSNILHLLAIWKTTGVKQRSISLLHKIVRCSILSMHVRVKVKLITSHQDQTSPFHIKANLPLAYKDQENNHWWRWFCQNQLVRWRQLVHHDDDLLEGCSDADIWSTATQTLNWYFIHQNVNTAESVFVHYDVTEWVVGPLQ